MDRSSGFELSRGLPPIRGDYTCMGGVALGLGTCQIYPFDLVSSTLEMMSRQKGILAIKTRRGMPNVIVTSICPRVCVIGCANELSSLLSSIPSLHGQGRRELR